MISSKWIWRITAGASILITLVLIAGFIYAVQDIQYPPSGQTASGTEEHSSEEESGMRTPEEGRDGLSQTTPPALPKEVKVTAIGDSLARGTGDNTGSGFVRRSIDKLKEHGSSGELVNNLAINGLTTAGLLPKLEEKGVQYALEQADLILLSIGGNDLFQGSGLTANSSEASFEIDTQKLVSTIPEASQRLKEILVKIRNINPEAKVVYVGLYHPFSDIKELLLPGNTAVTAWNYAAQQMVNEDVNMLMVPTFDLFQGKIDAYLSSDHFHPNADGYDAIADRIIDSIL